MILRIHSKTNIKSKRKRTKLSPAKLEVLKQEGELWHNRLGHISAPYLNRIKSCATGTTDFIFTCTQTECEICNQAKMTRKTFDKDREGASHPCQIIHADLITISVPTFIQGNKYILTVLDDYTRYLQTFVIKNKTNDSECLKQALINLKTMFPKKPYFRYLRTDNGTEFTSLETIKILDQFNIQPQLAEPYAHEHNGTIERIN